ncbi:MAG: ATP-binding protein, partial [Chloroflexota bacterium]
APAQANTSTEAPAASAVEGLAIGAGRARGVKAQVCRAFVAALGRVDNPAILPPALVQAGALVPSGENGLALLHEFADRPEWPARYLAARHLGERSAAASPGTQEAAWPVLLRLAADHERWVSEGAAWGLGALFAAEPYHWGQRFLAAFQPREGGDESPEALPPGARRALLFGVVPALRRQAPNAHRMALQVLDRAAGEDSSATRQLGSLIVGREVAEHLPNDALELVEGWAASGERARQWQAARAMTPRLRAIDPARAGAISAQMEQVDDPRVGNALRGALKGEGMDDSVGGAGVAIAASRPAVIERRDVSVTGPEDATLTGDGRVPSGQHSPQFFGPDSAWETTADIPIDARVIEQVVGQDRAVEIVRLAARQKRFVLLVGEPGTGKSMLAAAMAEMLGADDLEDILVVPNQESRISPLLEVVPAGEGERVVREAKKRRGETETAITFLFWTASLAASVVAGWYALATRSMVPGIVAAVVIAILWVVRRLVSAPSRHPVPKLLVNNARALEASRAPFVDATGFHGGALLGDVRHDPFQSGGYETPPHELVEPGAIHLAHRGVLFIDEVSTLSVESQQSLLTAIQEKRFSISGRTLGSSGTMIRTAPAPCDFLLILAGNMQDVEKMHPALRSRVRGYGYELYMNEEMPDTPENRAKLARFCAQEAAKDRKIPHLSRAAVDAVIEEARIRSGQPDRLTTRLRELGGLVRAAGDLAAQEGAWLVGPGHVAAARQNTRTLEEQISARLAPALARPSAPTRPQPDGPQPVADRLTDQGGAVGQERVA